MRFLFLVVVSAGAVDVAVGEFFWAGLSNFDDSAFEVQCDARERWIGVDFDDLVTDCFDDHGDGAVVGAALSRDPRTAGVCFTGSTQTALLIDRSMAQHGNPQAPLIAETGGLNAMIVDSTALPEAAVRDIVNSAFQSAGQRCSALRVLFVQKDIKARLLEMLEGAAMELAVGDPWRKCGRPWGMRGVYPAGIRLRPKRRPDRARRGAPWRVCNLHSGPSPSSAQKRRAGAQESQPWRDRGRLPPGLGRPRASSK